MLNKISEKYNVVHLCWIWFVIHLSLKSDYYDSHLDIISEESYTILVRDLNDSDKLNRKILECVCS